MFDIKYITSGPLAGKAGYSPLFPLVADKAGRTILAHGLHIVVGGAAAGKTVGSRGLLYTASDQSPTTALSCAMVATRESHTMPLSLGWFLANFLHPEVVKGTMFVDILDAVKRRADSSGPPVNYDVVLLDSITEWLWEVETLAIETVAPPAILMTGAERSAAAGAAESDEMRKVLTRRNSAAKAGGVVGEAIQFLRMLDNSAQLNKRCVIATINSVTYPLRTDSGKDAMSSLQAIVKGQVSALMVPELQKGGHSVMRISTRAEREPFDYPLDVSALDRAAADAGQGPAPAPQKPSFAPSKPALSVAINQKD